MTCPPRPGALPALAIAAIATAAVGCEDRVAATAASASASVGARAARAAPTPAGPPAPPAPPAPPPPTCDPTLPRAACAIAPVRRCADPADPRRVGEWRYALIAPLLAPQQDVTREELLAAWRGAGPATIAATPETTGALAPLLGPGKPAALAPDEQPALDAARWAIVPADALVPQWSVISIDGRHPLEGGPDAALTIPLCATGPAPPAPAPATAPAPVPAAPAPVPAPAPAAAPAPVPAPAPVRNIDLARVTTLAMTGTTALTRKTGQLIDRQGLPYVTRDVEPWLGASDLVHISNEVSMIPDCDPATVGQFSFCSRESYIKILEDSHAKIIELTGSHLTDRGQRWLLHTIDLYQQRGWVWFGGGRTQLEGTAPLVVEHHGNRLGLIGCNEVYTGQVIIEGPGPAACDLDRMVWQIGELLRQGIVPIVSIQHEEVYEHDPPGLIVRDFRRLAEAGAAFVFGSQAHTAHPWEVHAGAYLHYGAGNFYFDQQFGHTPEGVADRLYIHDGRLLTVGRLFTMLEDGGRPRPMTAPERARFLGEMAQALGRLGRAAPWAAPRVAEERPRPDSFLIGTRQQLLTIFTPEPAPAPAAAAPAAPAPAPAAPAPAASGAPYPLILDLVGDAHDPAAYVVRPRDRRAALPPRFVPGAIEFLTAKYPIDPARVRVNTYRPRPTARPKTVSAAQRRK